MLYHDSGLRGLSGISNDMRDLLASSEPAAAMAVDYFTLHVAQAVARLAVTLGGLDALIFTAGIGEHAPEIRSRVAGSLQFLGVQIDEGANSAGASEFQSGSSAVRVLVVPTDEERMIGLHTLKLLSAA